MKNKEEIFLAFSKQINEMYVSQKHPFQTVLPKFEEINYEW